MKNGITFTGIFVFVVIKLYLPLVLKVKDRTTLEQNMLPIKNEQFRKNKQKDKIDLIGIVVEVDGSNKKVLVPFMEPSVGFKSNS